MSRQFRLRGQNAVVPEIRLANTARAGGRARSSPGKGHDEGDPASGRGWALTPRRPPGVFVHGAYRWQVLFEVEGDLITIVRPACPRSAPGYARGRRSSGL
jgi:hypothetical protein